ncbi:MAG: hypothetical protein PF445_00450 [Melioribacteraceae bacterium]|nr:hypothetical protein [Melioribacteraceae bacterium]
MSNSNAITKLILLWAFSESALGGMLHVLRIPLTGLFVGGSAVIFISLIAHYSNNKTSILKATLLVLIIKFIVSPYTPLPAYFSVFAEGLLGLFLFNILNLKKTAPIILGFFALLFSSFQKIFVYTVLFGMTFWESIDAFMDFVLKQLSITSELNISFSYIIISIYISTHILGGILAGIVANRIPVWVDSFTHRIDYSKIIPTNEIEKKSRRRKKKFWYQKASGIIFILIALVLIALSYTTTAFDSNLPIKILVMFIRSIVITAIWFVLIAPHAMKLLQKILKKKKSDYTNEVENIVNLLPEMRAAVKYSWKESDKKKGLSRIKLFLSYIFVITLKEG